MSSIAGSNETSVGKMSRESSLMRDALIANDVMGLEMKSRESAPTDAQNDGEAFVGRMTDVFRWNLNLLGEGSCKKVYMCSVLEKICNLCEKYFISSEYVRSQCVRRINTLHSSFPSQLRRIPHSIVRLHLRARACVGGILLLLINSVLKITRFVARRDSLSDSFAQFLSFRVPCQPRGILHVLLTTYACMYACV